MKMKVWTSKIDEMSEKAKNLKQRSVPKGRKPIYPSEEEDDDGIVDEDESEEEDDKVFRLMIQLPDFGIAISLFGIESIEKTQRFVDTLNDPRFQYGIVINRNIPPSERYPKTDIEAWFEREDVRDRRYNELLQNLQDAGYKITNV